MWLVRLVAAVVIGVVMATPKTNNTSIVWTILIKIDLRQIFIADYTWHCSENPFSLRNTYDLFR
jgi:hypothetical protein